MLCLQASAQNFQTSQQRSSPKPSAGMIFLGCVRSAVATICCPIQACYQHCACIVARLCSAVLTPYLLEVTSAAVSEPRTHILHACIYGTLSYMELMLGTPRGFCTGLSSQPCAPWTPNLESSHPGYMGVSKNQGPDIDPKWQGSYCQDTDKKGPIINGNSHIILLSISSKPALFQPQTPLSPEDPQFIETAINKHTSTKGPHTSKHPTPKI